MKEYLNDIISRMLDKSDVKMEVGFVSSETISWKAHREAEEVSNSDLISPLITLIDSSKNKKFRDRGLFLLGKLAKNTKDIAATQYLIDRVKMESDKYVLSSLLDRIAELKKPFEIDIEPLIDVLNNDIWQIRQSGIKSLTKSQNDKAETVLIDILEKSTNEYDLIYSSSTLSNIGTLRSIPILEKQFKSKKRDVKQSAIFAIKEILSRIDEENTNR